MIKTMFFLPLLLTSSLNGMLARRTQRTAPVQQLRQNHSRHHSPQVALRKYSNKDSTFPKCIKFNGDCCARVIEFPVPSRAAHKSLEFAMYAQLKAMEFTYEEMHPLYRESKPESGIPPIIKEELSERLEGVTRLLELHLAYVSPNHEQIIQQILKNGYALQKALPNDKNQQ